MFEMPNLNQLESRYAMNNLEMNPLMNFASQAIDYFVQACGEKNQIIFTPVEKQNSRFGISLNLLPSLSLTRIRSLGGQQITCN